LAKTPEFDVQLLLRRLTERGCDFVVVGGIAAVLHGGATLTVDLDVCVATDLQNLDAVAEVLVALDARLRGIDEEVPFVPDGRALARLSLATLQTSAGPLDLLVHPDGAPPYDRLRRNAERKRLGDFSVLVASLDDLIAMKRAAGRPKDLVAVEELQAIKRLRRRLKISE
jgi:predicted nucleotidyltransferase